MNSDLCNQLVLEQMRFATFCYIRGSYSVMTLNAIVAVSQLENSQANACMLKAWPLLAMLVLPRTCEVAYISAEAVDTRLNSVSEAA